MFYTVFSTNDNPSMQWQSDLLEYSWKKVGQEGELVRLVATDDPNNLPRQKYARCVATQSWDVHPDTGDNYPIYNKPASLLEWAFRERPEGTVLLLDPDCMFRKPVTRRVAPGFPAAQAWVNLPKRDADAEHPFGLCDGSLDVGEIGSKLSAEFDLAEEQLAPDIHAAVDRLREIGFLSLSR